MFTDCFEWYLARHNCCVCITDLHYVLHTTSDNIIKFHLYIVEMYLNKHNKNSLVRYLLAYRLQLELYRTALGFLHL